MSICGNILLEMSSSLPFIAPGPVEGDIVTLALTHYSCTGIACQGQSLVIDPPP